MAANNKFSSTISPRMRAEVLARDDYTCQMCGLCESNADPAIDRNFKLHVSRIVRKEHGGRDELNNLRTLCSTCYRGAKYLRPSSSSIIRLLSQVPRAGQNEQLTVYNWLCKKFKNTT